MDLRSLVNDVVQSVNDDEQVTLLQSDGYTIGSGGKRTPKYKTPVTVFAQIQALDGVDLKQIDGLNIQGTIRAIYISGELAGVIRPDQMGGDIIQRNGQDWLIVKVLESWTNWTKAAMVLQGGA